MNTENSNNQIGGYQTVIDCDDESDYKELSEFTYVAPPKTEFLKHLNKEDQLTHDKLVPLFSTKNDCRILKCVLSLFHKFRYNVFIFVKLMKIFST